MANSQIYKHPEVNKNVIMCSLNREELVTQIYEN